MTSWIRAVFLAGLVGAGASARPADRPAAPDEPLPGALVWGRPVEIERGVGYFGNPWSIPLGVAEGEAEDGLAILYGLRTEDPSRYAVYVRWSRDGGRTWEDRRPLGVAAWVTAGAVQTLAARFVRYGGRLCVWGAWDDAVAPEDPRAPQALRLHAVSPAEERVLADFPCRATDDATEAPFPQWVHRLGVTRLADRDVLWGVRGRDPAGEGNRAEVEVQPFVAIGEEADRPPSAVRTLGPWRGVSGGWMADTLEIVARGGELRVEGYDLSEGGWVSLAAGGNGKEGAALSPPDAARPADGRRVEDLLPQYMAVEAPILRLWRWEGRPGWRLLSFLEGGRARSTVVTRDGPRGAWRSSPAAWEQPSFVWDFAADGARAVFSCVVGVDVDETCRVFAMDAAGRAAEEPAFAGVAAGLAAPAVALGRSGRMHVLFRVLPEGGGREEYLLARSKRAPAPGDCLDEAQRARAASAIEALIDPDPERQAAARAALVTLGPAAVPFLSERFADASRALRAEIQRMIDRLAPPWMERKAPRRDGKEE